MADKVLELLCSSAKIERDRGVVELQRQIDSADPVFVKDLEISIQRILEDPSSPWESKHGGLMGCTALVLHEEKHCSDEFVQKARDYALGLLEDNEQRVRFASGMAL